MRAEKLYTAAVILSLLISALLCAVLVFMLNYNLRGERCLAAGEYQQARLWFEKASNLRKAELCDAYLLEQRYLNGRRSLQSGDYDRAREILRGLGAYKDAENLLLSCDYLEAEELRRGGELERALELYRGLDAYPGCAERAAELDEELAERSYRRAAELARELRLEEACAIWETLGDRHDSAQLLSRGRALIEWLGQREETHYTDPTRLFSDLPGMKIYADGLAYLAVPEELDRDARFLIYYPGGRDEDLYLEYFESYLRNPPPNTLSLFLRRNGVSDMRNMGRMAVECLDRAAAECGVFLRDPVFVGSSLGAYPALFGVIEAERSFGLRSPCLLLLDAGNDWQEQALLPDRAACRELAAVGTELYLFESPWVGLDRPAIQLLADTGNAVTLVGCVQDEHSQITRDALSCGVLDWAFGDREEPFASELYSFRLLSGASAS